MGSNLPAGCDLVAYGGNAEDVVLMRAFGDQSGGFFVDVGAGNPVQGSLTKNLVDRLGWRGVNLEPLPERFESLRATRPGDVTLDVAIGEQAGLASFFRIVPGRGRPVAVASALWSGMCWPCTLPMDGVVRSCASR
jgi:hypothetical protein